MKLLQFYLRYLFVIKKKQTPINYAGAREQQQLKFKWKIQPRKYLFIFLDIKYVIFIYLMDIRKTYNSFILKYLLISSRILNQFFSIKQSLLCEIINVEFGFVITILSCLSSWIYLNTIWMKISQVFLLVSFCILNQNVSIK